MKINCIIIDDEPSSQNIIKKFINDIDFLNLVGVCNNAVEGLQKLTSTSTIDLIFLDINMPKITGLTFYKSLKNPPDVIFTTAYSQYAVDGFEVSAIDYLLKPFSFERFYIATSKVLEKTNTKNKNEISKYLLIKSNKTLHKVYTATILYIEAYGDYVKVHLKDHFIVTNSTFTSILKLLPEDTFIRTHKSFAVNSELINSISGNKITMNTYSVPIGQKYKSLFLKFVQMKN